MHKRWLSVLSAVALLAAFFFQLPARHASAAPLARSYVAGNFTLSLAGAEAGWLKSVDGGNAIADVISQPVGAESFASKALGPTRYEDFSLQFGPGTGKPLFDAIASSWSGKAGRLNGAITSYSATFDAQESREFENAWITETTIPACDAASKEAAYMTVKLAAELVRAGKASGKPALAASKSDKLWLASNFRLELDGLDCTRITKIDAFTVKQGVTQDSAGSARVARKEAAKIDFPNITVTLADAGAETWKKWADESLIQGKASEKNGRIVFLSANRSDALLEIKLSNVGIYTLQNARRESSSDSVARLQAGLYVERMELVGPAAAK